MVGRKRLSLAKLQRRNQKIMERWVADNSLRLVDLAKEFGLHSSSVSVIITKRVMRGEK